MGILTRIAIFFYFKKFKKDVSIFLSFFTVGVVLLPLISAFVGFDVAVSEYLVALIIWLLFDLMRIKINFKRMKK